MVIPPLVPAGTIAALAITNPSGEFSVDTVEEGCPAGHLDRKPSGPRGTTVMLRAYACAFAGMPHGLAGISHEASSKKPPTLSPGG
jgi:hypothetical protein